MSACRAIVTIAVRITRLGGLILAILLSTTCTRKQESTTPKHPAYIHDDPAAALRYAIAIRLPAAKQIPVEALSNRYRAAISHSEEMGVYSTATRSSFRPTSRLRHPMIRTYETSKGFSLETLIGRASHLAAVTSGATPNLYSVASSTSEIQTAAALGTWSPLGPVDTGGRSRSLLINPIDHNPDIMVLATAGGGIWRTTNGGVTWVPVFDDKPTLSVSTLAMAPSDYNHMYAGTGEGFGNIDAISGNGIYESTNNGKDWSPLPETMNNRDFATVQKIVVSPDDSSRIYAATGTGVFVRLEQHWKKLDTSSGPLDARKINGCTDLAAAGKSTDEDHIPVYIFASCGNLAPGTVYRIADSSQPGLLEVVLQTQGRTSLAVAPSRPALVYAMAAMSDPENDPNGPTRPDLQMVYRSDHHGNPGTWVSATDMSVLLNRLLLTNVDFCCQLPVYGFPRYRRNLSRHLLRSGLV